MTFCGLKLCTYIQIHGMTQNRWMDEQTDVKVEKLESTRTAVISSPSRLTNEDNDVEQYSKCI